MKKNKKSKAKTGKKTSLFGGAAKSLKKLSKGNGLSRLSTTQKVVGGAALLAVGLSYLAKRSTVAAKPPGAARPDAAAAEQNLASLDGGAI